MNELFQKSEINPTVSVTITMNQDERELFKQFAKDMNFPLSAFIRLACKKFMAEEGVKYGKQKN